MEARSRQASYFQRVVEVKLSSKHCEIWRELLVEIFWIRSYLFLFFAVMMEAFSLSIEVRAPYRILGPSSTFQEIAVRSEWYIAPSMAGAAFASSNGLRLTLAQSFPSRSIFGKAGGMSMSNRISGPP